MKELREAEELQETEEVQKMEDKNEDKEDSDQGDEKDGQKENGQGDKKDQACHLLSSSIPQRFSFLPSEQGTYVEPVLKHEIKKRSNHLWKLSKKKYEEEKECNTKRCLTNMEYGEFTDFALFLVNKLERNEKQVEKVIQMAMDKNEVLVDIWRSLISQEDKDMKIKKFVALTNIQFDIVGATNIIFRVPGYVI
ncbi:hypothetical protein C1646_676244 [Rhizophagus diaphanus]|nr:hypothetical protein C1646_676244 [Rhizophagus diaphanus] [Rhizophagus sp. MUCL 43196]